MKHSKKFIYTVAILLLTVNTTLEASFSSKLSTASSLISAFGGNSSASGVSSLLSILGSDSTETEAESSGSTLLNAYQQVEGLASAFTTKGTSAFSDPEVLNTILAALNWGVENVSTIVKENPEIISGIFNSFNNTVETIAPSVPESSMSSYANLLNVLSGFIK